MPRIRRTADNNYELCSWFINQEKDYAKSRTSSMSFDGNIFSSYGTPIAVVNNDTLVVDSRKSTVTTEQHKSCVRSAHWHECFAKYKKSLDDPSSVSPWGADDKFYWIYNTSTAHVDFRKVEPIIPLEKLMVQTNHRDLDASVVKNRTKPNVRAFSMFHKTYYSKHKPCYCWDARARSLVFKLENKYKVETPQQIVMVMMKHPEIRKALNLRAIDLFENFFIKSE